ncbi:chemotaxis protein CheX [bacterium AH-315-P07]|nr:chemotaxis protein CheX [bacterium AH-315-P07]
MQNINLDIIIPFIAATRSAFEIMLGMELSQKEAYVKKNSVMFGDITGSVGLSGKVRGTVSLSLPADFALECIRTMTQEGEEMPLNDSVVHDGVGELMSMIAGGAKTTLSGTESPINFTLPAIVSGRGHEMHHQDGTCNTSIIFESEPGKEFALDVCLSTS